MMSQIDPLQIPNYTLCDSALNGFENFSYYTRQMVMSDELGDYYVNMDATPSAKKKFAITWHFMKKLDILPKSLGSKYDSFDNMTELAQEFRIKGNQCFKAKKYIAAIDSYTKCLMHSKRDSECYVFAMNNRSIAFFYKGMFKECVTDLHRVYLSKKYPVSLLYKLFERAGNAYRKLGNRDNALEHYSQCLSYLEKSTLTHVEKINLRSKINEAIQTTKGITGSIPPMFNVPVDKLLGGKHENIPAFSKYLELKCTEDMGRGVYATCDINPGDVVVIDKPYIGESCPGINFVCNYSKCLKLNMAVIPCPKCLRAVYCDDQCMIKAIDDDEHSVLCPLMYFIEHLPGVAKLNVLVMKWFLKDSATMGLSKFCSMVNNLSKNNLNNKTKGFDENGQYKSDNSWTVFCLEDFEKKNVSMDVLVFLNCIAVDMTRYLQLCGYKIPFQYIATIGASLVHMLHVLLINCWYLNTAAPCIYNKIQNMSISLTMYPSICLFNHSCDANVWSSGVLSDKTRVLKAIQPIPKGSQLFINYGSQFNLQPKPLRAQILNYRFKFICCCQPCFENWPINRYIPNRLSALNILDKSMANTVAIECQKLEGLLDTLSIEDFRDHLNFLYTLLKLLSTNVKRPFRFYEQCLALIIRLHYVIEMSPEHLNLAEVFSE